MAKTHHNLIVCANHAGPATVMEFMNGITYVFRRLSRHQRVKRVKMSYAARNALPGGLCYDCRVKLFERRKTREIHGFFRSEVANIARSLRRR